MSLQYDPFTVPDLEHYQDEDKSQELVTGITGTTDVAPSQEREVGVMVAERDMLLHADKTLRRSIVSSLTPAQPVFTQGMEIILRQVYCPANVPVQLCVYNFNRSRLVISGTGANVAVAQETMTGPLVVAMPPGNSVVIGYATTFFCRTLNTIRDMWIIADAAISVSVQEEFFVR